MNSKKILEKGYFPKELPPPFETKKFAEKAHRIRREWRRIRNNQNNPQGQETGRQARHRARNWYKEKYSSSKLAKFNYPKNKLSRRKLGVPNPMHFMFLVDEITANWSFLREKFKLSPYSASYPVEHGAKRALRTKSKTLNEFKFLLAEKATNHKVELRMDISQFYPSIYTHSISWALLGKEEAKRAFKIKTRHPTRWAAQVSANDPVAVHYLFAESIDSKIRNCNEQHSIGIPIGPDTSFVIAELIGNRIDHEIKKRLSSINHQAIRYFDDYYFYIDNTADSEFVRNVVQQVLHEYELDVNTNKVIEERFPFKSLEEEWVPRLANFKFTSVNKYEIRSYFSLLFRLQENNKENSSWLVNYSLLRFEYGDTRISRETWPIFLNFLLQTLFSSPSNIEQIFKIILTYNDFISGIQIKKISIIAEKIIDEHIELDHSYEVSWALWIIKTFRTKCSRDLLARILKSKDNFSRLIALDIISNRLYTGRKPALSNLERELTSKELFNENWLFAYEAYKKNWLTLRAVNYSRDHEFMALLFDNNVSFYKEENQLRPEFEINSPRAIGPGSRTRGEGGGWYAGHRDVQDIDAPNEGGTMEISTDDFDFEDLF